MEDQDHDTQIHRDHDDNLRHVKAPLLCGDGVQGDIWQGLVVGHTLMSEGKWGCGEDPVGEEEEECWNEGKNVNVKNLIQRNCITLKNCQRYTMPDIHTPFMSYVLTVVGQERIMVTDVTSGHWCF